MEAVGRAGWQKCVLACGLAGSGQARFYLYLRQQSIDQLCHVLSGQEGQVARSAQWGAWHATEVPVSQHWPCSVHLLQEELHGGLEQQSQDLSRYGHGSVCNFWLSDCRNPKKVAELKFCPVMSVDVEFAFSLAHLQWPQAPSQWGKPRENCCL